MRVPCQVELGDSRFESIRIDSFAESIRIDSADRIETITFRFATFEHAQLVLGFNVIFKSYVHCGNSYFRFCFVIHAYLVTFFAPPTNNIQIYPKKWISTIFAPLLCLTSV